MSRLLRLLPPPPVCGHTVERRGLTWRCRLDPHGPDQAHVLRTVR